MKKMVASLFATVCIFWLAQSVGATTLTYTDSSTDRWPGNDVTYTLIFNPAGDSTYDATFSIINTSDTSPEWYAGWFLFKFATGNNPADIFAVTFPTSDWSVADTNENSNVNVLQGGTYVKLLAGPYVGFYVTSLAMNGTDDDPTQGILLTDTTPGTPFEFKFKFRMSGGELNLESMPFQVGYYDGLLTDTRQIKYNGLSVDLGAPVPEPATMFLLGTGLIGIGIFVRRKFRK